MLAFASTARIAHLQSVQGSAMRALAHWSNVGTFAENSSCRIVLTCSEETHVAQIFQFEKMPSTTVPPAPMTCDVGIGFGLETDLRLLFHLGQRRHEELLVLLT